MAKDSVAPKATPRPALDTSAPWAANAARQQREGDGSREVVYCVTVPGLSLVKIGRTSQLKKRLSQLSTELGKPLFIAYFAEFKPDDARDVERCALLRMRKHYECSGEWSLTDPICGVAALRSAWGFLGVNPAFEGGAPHEEETDDEIAEVRVNTAVRRHVNANGYERARLPGEM
jgi:hypothetical protein